MGWQDRDYASDHSGGGTMRTTGMPGVGPFQPVTIIIIANIVMYFLTHPSGPVPLHAPHGQPTRLGQFCVLVPELVWQGQIWRLFTATYMHAGFNHIFMNMLMLYFFGPLLERRWGLKQFLLVYTLGGVIGNVLLTIAGAVGFIHPSTSGLGASGSVWAIMAAPAIYYPQLEILFMFLVPLRLRTFVGLYAIWFVYNIFSRGSNYGGDVCHLAGLAFGLWWARTGGISLRGAFKSALKRVPDPVQLRPGNWAKRIKQRQVDAQAVDRILSKVHDHGIHSLTEEEKRTLLAATERQRAEESEAGRTDRL